MGVATVILLSKFAVVRADVKHLLYRGIVASLCGVAGAVMGVSGAVAETVVSASGETPSVVTGPAGAGVYRSTGANGEVEFNNFGRGEPVALDVVPPTVGAELERSSARVQEMLDVAQVLAADRQVRESNRAAKLLAVAQAKAAAARESARLAGFAAATQPRFYPAFSPRLGVGFGPRRRPGYGPGSRPRSGPYRDGYRYPEQPAAPAPAPVRGKSL